MGNLAFPASQIADFRVFRDLGAEGIADLTAALRSLKDVPLKSSALRRTVIEATRGRKVDATILFRQLLALYRLQQKGNISVSELLTTIRTSLEQSEWPPQELQAWDDLTPVLTDLLTVHVVALTVKALDLAYDYSNLLQSARILTDIRPVFGDDAKDIEAAVISHTLELRYRSHSGLQGLSITLDSSDIEGLRKQIDRAIAKGKGARAYLTKTGIGTIVPGEE